MKSKSVELGSISWEVRTQNHNPRVGGSSPSSATSDIECSNSRISLHPASRSDHVATKVISMPLLW